MLIIPSQDRLRERYRHPVLQGGWDAFKWQHERVKVRRDWIRDGLLWQPVAYHFATFLTSGNNSDNASGTTLDTSATMNLTSGSCIISWCKWEGTNGSAASYAKNDGTNSFSSPGVTNHSNADLHCQWFYLLTHSMSGATTLRFTLDSARPFRKMCVMEFSYTGTASFDNSTINIQVGTTSVTSGNITVSGNAQIACGGYGEYTADTTATETINGVAADGKVTAGGLATQWRKTIAAGFTGAAAAANITSSDHLTGIISINVTAAGAAGLFRNNPMTGLGVGGPFFADPLSMRAN